MSAPLKIGGYAAPFHVPAMVDGVREHIEPGAFRLGGRCELQLGYHEGPLLACNAGAGGLSCWQDEYGLAFSATVPDNWNVERAVRQGLECSVNFAPWRGLQAFDAVEWEDANGVRHRRVTAGQIDHIALMFSGLAIYGAAAGVWLQHEPIENISPALTIQAMTWQRSEMNFRAQRAEGRGHGARSRPARGQFSALTPRPSIPAKRPPHPPELQARIEAILAAAPAASSAVAAR